jgi:hypothetical protein
MGALISFLGGSAFRMIWGEVSSYFTAKQEHKYEIERMQAQGELEAAAHKRNLESISLQADLGVKEIQVKAGVALSQSEMDAWQEVSKSTARLTGIKWIDLWNGSIRPFLASMAIVAVIAEIIVAGWVLTEWDQNLFGCILGLYVADRSLTKRGK